MALCSYCFSCLEKQQLVGALGWLRHAAQPVRLHLGGGAKAQLSVAYESPARLQVGVVMYGLPCVGWMH
jgi:hypothetical protein